MIFTQFNRLFKKTSNPRLIGRLYGSVYIVPAIWTTGFIMFCVLLALTTRLQGSDDTIFQNDVLPYPTAFDWVAHRYQNWSGRYFSEFFTYIFSSQPLILWKIVSAICFAALSLSLYGYFKLATKAASAVDSRWMIGFAVTVSYLINVKVLYDGGFWISGSMNYFWITAMAIAGFYPVAYTIINMSPPPRYILFACALAAIIGSTTEQAGTVLLALTSIFLGYGLYSWKITRSRAFPLVPSIFWAIILIAWLIMFSAPGNEVRTAAETASWLPQAAATPALEKLDYRMRWFVNALVNHSGFILSSLYVCLGIAALTLLTARKKVMGYLLIVAGILIANRTNPAVTVLTEFNSQWGVMLERRASYLAIAAWIFIIILSVAACVLMYRQKKDKFWLILAILLLAAYASTAIVTLSPTLYVSGIRTYFVPSQIFAVVIYLLVAKMMLHHAIWRTYVLPILIILSVVTYVYLLLLLRSPHEALTPFFV